MNKGYVMSDNRMEEIIKCPKCRVAQTAEIEIAFPDFIYIHDCVKCGYVIMESEWETC